MTQKTPPTPNLPLIMKPTRALLAASALFTLAFCSAQAAVIVNYAMTANGAALNSSLFVGPTDTATNVTATTLVNQSGGGPAGNFTYNGNTDIASSWSITFDSAATNFAGAVTAGNYFTFSITPDAGHQLDLTSITFQVASGSSNTSSNRAFYLVTESNPANFSSSSTVLSTDRTPGGGGTIPVQADPVTNTVPKDYSVDLSSFTGITTTQYFRFYLQASIGQSLTFDDIIVNGTVSAIPEPSSFAALAGLAGLGLAARRRRRG
jgi:hypothetical protein